MQKRHTDRECYFNEQARTTRKYYIPYICRHIGIIPPKILEVGCGEGGNLLPFAELGCEVVGIDLAASRIEQARLFFKQRKHPGTFIASDIVKLKAYHGRFPLIIVHDVIEHIEDKARFLADLQPFLASGGHLFVGFPAWQMPFGGHQQIARGKLLSCLPFIHLLPVLWYERLLRISAEKEDVVRELLSIKRTRCTIEMFEEVARGAEYEVVNQQLYLINPHYETKFGLKPRKLNGAIARLPYWRNFLSTSCFYVLSKKTE